MPAADLTTELVVLELRALNRRQQSTIARLRRELRRVEQVAEDLRREGVERRQEVANCTRWLFEARQERTALRQELQEQAAIIEGLTVLQEQHPRPGNEEVSTADPAEHSSGESSLEF
eukprot:3688453-Prorocentrum_lima.AAC.1